MLDTVREFAAERIDGDEALAGLERRHADYFLGYCEAGRGACGPLRSARWLDRLAQERGNIRLAFERLLQAGASEEALRVAIAFARALPWDAHAHEVRGWLAQVLGAALPAERRAAGLYWDGTLALSQGLFGDAEARLEEALAAAARPATRPSRPRCWPLWAAGQCSWPRRMRPSCATRPCLLPAAPGTRSWWRTRSSPAGACERPGLGARRRHRRRGARAIPRGGRPVRRRAWALAEQGWYAMVHGRLEESEEHLARPLTSRRQHGDDRRLVEPLIVRLAPARAWERRGRRAASSTACRLHATSAIRSMSGGAGRPLGAGRARRARGGRRAARGRLRGAARADRRAALGVRHGDPGRALAGAREALGASFTTHFDEGRRLSAEDAVARLASGSAVGDAASDPR